MAAKTGGKTRGGRGERGLGERRDFFGFDPSFGWLRDVKDDATPGRGRRVGRAWVIAPGTKASDVDGWDALPEWIKERAEKRRGELTFAVTDAGPLWILMPTPKGPSGHHGGQLDISPYGAFRDLAGLLAGSQLDYGLDALELRFFGASDDEVLGTLVGLGLGIYRYRSVKGMKADKAMQPKLVLSDVRADLVARAATLAAAVNLARHLVNTPASELNPQTFATSIADYFAGSSTMTVEVLAGARLGQERMGLLQAVGGGAAAGPALVHLRYRPHGKASGIRPIAFVGKGVTFDSGGLDLKDAASMRLMKKDMGGAGSLVGLAYWVDAARIATPCDFYLSLAENSVDERSFRPGDVLTSRGGATIEIDNTDAEGRLVLADAIDYAVKQEGKDAPSALIDLATLTGAMRIGLGVRLAGLFASDDALAETLLRSAQRRADPAWRMPLVAEYITQLKSSVADLANSGPGRFGGAITAALFLQRFVGKVPWAHFDMYAWTDSNVGGCTEPGGNGQCVQLLADYLAAMQASKA